ncbi:uncharacterized protein [Anoplolepis gracilipes]|uniref:uncharacterized protein n=1 Tax=Anoplolepis gracilipes TaxID=354296 RepID=UPI003B9FF7B7
MKKRRPHIKSYSSSQKYSYTHEHFPIKTKSIYESKERNSKRSYSKLQQNNKYYDNTSCLKEDAFGSLESLFDLKKSLNLRDVYPLAFNVCNEKLFKVSNITKSEPLIETLFLQSFSQQTNPDSHIFKPYNEYEKVKEENVKNQIKASEKFQTKVSKSVRKLQQNDLIYNQQNNSVNMAENEIVDNEVSEEQPEKDKESAVITDEAPTAIDVAEDEVIDEIPVTTSNPAEDEIIDEAPTTLDLAEAKIVTENKNEDKDADESKDKDKVEENNLDNKDDNKGDKVEDEDKINERIEEIDTSNYDRSK